MTSQVEICREGEEQDKVDFKQIIEQHQREIKEEMEKK